jgi:hypothetical protein
MKLNKLAVAAAVIAASLLSGCVVVPPRAYVAPPAVYVHPYYGYGDYDHDRHWHRY